MIEVKKRSKKRIVKNTTKNDEAYKILKKNATDVVFVKSNGDLISAEKFDVDDDFLAIAQTIFGIKSADNDKQNSILAMTEIWEPTQEMIAKERKEKSKQTSFTEQSTDVATTTTNDVNEGVNTEGVNTEGVNTEGVNTEGVNTEGVNTVRKETKSKTKSNNKNASKKIAKKTNKKQKLDIVFTIAGDTNLSNVTFTSAF